MKYKIRAKIEGNLFLEQPRHTITAARDGMTFELESDEHNRVSAISVIATLPADRAAIARATITHAPDKDHVDFHVDKGFHDELVSELQNLESILSFNWKGHPLKRILWNEPEISLLPENTEEEARVHLWSLSIGRRPPQVPALVREKSFQTLVRFATRFEDIAIATAFWREGGNQMEAGEYPHAFYSYYFVIEDFYADGKTSEAQVLRAFAASAQFCQICSDTLPRFFGTNDEHEAVLRELFAAEQCGLDVAGLQKFLFRMRGNMHHYFRKGRRPHPTPFNKDQFHAVALVSLFIATVALHQKVAELNRKHSSTTLSGTTS